MTITDVLIIIYFQQFLHIFVWLSKISLDLQSHTYDYADLYGNAFTHIKYIRHNIKSS